MLFYFLFASGQYEGDTSWTGAQFGTELARIDSVFSDARAVFLTMARRPTTASGRQRRLRIRLDSQRLLSSSRVAAHGRYTVSVVRLGEPSTPPSQPSPATEAPATATGTMTPQPDVSQGDLLTTSASSLTLQAPPSPPQRRIVRSPFRFHVDSQESVGCTKWTCSEFLQELKRISPLMFAPRAPPAVFLSSTRRMTGRSQSQKRIRIPFGKTEDRLLRSFRVAANGRYNVNVERSANYASELLDGKIVTCLVDLPKNLCSLTVQLRFKDNSELLTVFNCHLKNNDKEIHLEMPDFPVDTPTLVFSLSDLKLSSGKYSIILNGYVVVSEPLIIPFDPSLSRRQTECLVSSNSAECGETIEIQITPRNNLGEIIALRALDVAEVSRQRKKKNYSLSIENCVDGQIRTEWKPTVPGRYRLRGSVSIMVPEEEEEEEEEEGEMEESIKTFSHGSVIEILQGDVAVVTLGVVEIVSGEEELYENDTVILSIQIENVSRWPVRRDGLQIEIRKNDSQKPIFVAGCGDDHEIQIEWEGVKSGEYFAFVDGVKSTSSFTVQKDTRVSPSKSILRIIDPKYGVPIEGEEITFGVYPIRDDGLPTRHIEEVLLRPPEGSTIDLLLGREPNSGREFVWTFEDSGKHFVIVNGVEIGVFGVVGRKEEIPVYAVPHCLPADASLISKRLEDIANGLAEDIRQLIGMTPETMIDEDRRRILFSVQADQFFDLWSENPFHIVAKPVGLLAQAFSYVTTYPEHVLSLSIKEPIHWIPQPDAYTIGDLIGRGGEGVVRSGADRSGGDLARREFVIKKIHVPGDEEMLLQEREVLMTIEAMEHENTVKCYGCYMALKDVLHIVLEPCGKDLRAFLARKKRRMTNALKLDCIHQLAKGILYLHSINRSS